MRYGILSDIHRINPQIVPIAINALKNEGVEKLILNGDITGDQFQHLDDHNYLAYVLQSAGESGLETYIQPGSHEELRDFNAVLHHLTQRYSNLIDVTKERKINNGDHHLVFLPGSDWRAGRAQKNGFSIESSEHESGIYETPEGGILQVSSISDLAKYVTEPEKTTLICHVPIKFNSQNTVDMAYFAEKSDGSLMPGIALENMIRQKVGQQASQQIIEQIALQNGYTFKRENRGNQDLADAYDNLGITKSITGHFHESVHNAHDSNGNHIQGNEFNNELFWMASYIDGLKAGILTLEGNQAAYQNIDLKKYLE